MRRDVTRRDAAMQCEEACLNGVVKGNVSSLDESRANGGVVERFKRRGCNQCLSRGVKADRSLSGWEEVTEEELGGRLIGFHSVREHVLRGNLPFYLPFILFGRAWNGVCYATQSRTMNLRHVIVRGAPLYAPLVLSAASKLQHSCTPLALRGTRERENVIM